VTGNLIEYVPFDRRRPVPTIKRGTGHTDGRASYIAPRMIELTRSFAITACGEAGCPGVAPMRGPS
jgi:hypothetical protein